MALPRIEERTLYSPLISHLQNIGFKAVGETKVVKKHPDIFFQVNSLSFVIEVKIGKPEIGLKAVAQASDYAKKLGTRNIIILIYPEKYRNQVILDSGIVQKIALNEKVDALVLTEYWTESLTIEPLKLFEQLKKRILLKKIKVDFRTIVKLIEGYVRDLNSIIYQIKAEKLITEVVDKLDLFSSIGEIKNKETAKRQVINLASYLLFNQLLFYHIYRRKADSKRLPELEEIENIRNLQKYFDEITNIDYQSIYRINILAHIPNKEVVINTLNEVIKAIKLLRAEHITHDLAGRFFHDLIPFEVRKVLAAFYTHPIAAEILAGLTIDSYDEMVIDPACGSGTLLVAAYRRKQELYQKLYGYKDLRKMHKKFIENDLTGIDIMPFAAHITTINLTMQNIEQETNVVRIGTKDSLDFAKSLKTMEFTKKGLRITPYTETIQETLFGISEQKIKKEGAIAPEGKGIQFYLKPVDVVIMNPPFSDREKMPEEMREKLKKNPLGNICGHQVNLWGYFLALADLLLKPGGKIGAVIPINIARGKATEKIRKFLLENYHIKYIVKPVGDIAFSEGAAFRDVLLIAEKRKPKKDDVTKIVFLKKSIRTSNIEDIECLISLIRREESFVNENLEIRSIRHEDLLSFKDNLMPVLSQGMKIGIDLFEKIKNSDKLIKIRKGSFPEGFHASPKGLSQLVFITNPLTNDRIKRAFLILDNSDNKKIIAKIKDTNKKIAIPKNISYPALRTITGINTIEVKKYDYFIFSKYKDFDFILTLSKWDKKKPIPWGKIKNEGDKKRAFLLLPERFNPYSKNTHVLAFVSDEKLVTPHTIRIGLDFNKEEAKIQALLINSIVFLLQIFLNREETTGEYIHIMESDLILMYILNLEYLSESEKQTLLNLFEKLKDVEFPSILEQLENRFWARVELDKTILKILGFSDGEINKWLPTVYDALVEELKAMKGVK